MTVRAGLVDRDPAYPGGVGEDSLHRARGCDPVKSRAEMVPPQVWWAAGGTRTAATGVSSIHAQHRGLSEHRVGQFSNRYRRR